MRMPALMLDEGGQGLIGEVALELVPGADLAGEAAHFECEERS